MKLELNLEIVTPLFLGGADPNQAELRPASMRGALRYWLRAALGGVIGDKNLPRLYELESAVFGEAERGSAVTVRLLNRLNDGLLPVLNDANQTGINYLWFSMKGHTPAANRRAIGALQTCRWCLQTRGSNAAPLRRTAEALWLLTHLGGLGARSRRGAGSVQVKDLPANWPQNVPLPVIQAQTPTALKNDIANGLRQIRQNLSQTTGITAPVGLADTDFDVLHPDTGKVWVLDREFGSWQEALELVGGATQSFRLRYAPDYTTVKSAVNGGSSLTAPVERAIFGLPIVFYFSSLSGKSGTLEGSKHDRRASPLLIHIAKLANNRFAVVLTVFYAHLLPAGERLKLKRKGSASVSGAAPSGWAILDNFLSHLDTQVASRLEVDYR